MLNHFKYKLSIFIVCAFCRVCTAELRCLTFNYLLLHRPFKLLPYCNSKIPYFVKFFLPNFSNIAFMKCSAVLNDQSIKIFAKWHRKNVNFLTVEAFDILLDSLDCCFLHRKTNNPLSAKNDEFVCLPMFNY